MALLGGIQRRNLPGQIVIPRPGLSLWILIVTPTKGKPGQLRGQPSRSTYRRCKEVCLTGDREIGRGGTGNRSAGSAVTAQLVRDGFGRVTDPWRGGIK